MRPRSRDLGRPPLPQLRRYAVDPSLPQRYRPVGFALADTGLLYSLAHRPRYLELFLELYGETVTVAEAVADEIRAVARVPQLDRPHRNLVLMGSCADRLVVKLNSGAITVAGPPEDSDDLRATVMRQLREHDRAAAEWRGEAWNLIDASRAKRHNGEIESILVAVGVIKSGGTALLLTNDGGASRVAWQHEVSAQNLRHVLAELACADPELDEGDLLVAFEEMTAHFGTLPEGAGPADSSAFRCRARADKCHTCDPLANQVLQR
ncbi:hypothetical protein ACGFX4_40200 [Kitasatospora sp. NPDC048365]|uniref:hypothetical protein n=1 Tax=Kitasatospora sp. NPDC048365 TaxID=3364050 RepID=UPI00371728D9